MPHVDHEGTPEHTTHFESCGCSEAREAALRAENERLEDLLKVAAGKLANCYQDYKKYRKKSEVANARIAELEAAVRNVEWGDGTLNQRRCPDCRGWPIEGGHAPDCQLAAALKGDTDDA